MKKSVNKLFLNREDLENIELKSSTLRDTANKFKVISNKLERDSRLKNLKMKVLIGVVFVVMTISLYFFVF